MDYLIKNGVDKERLAWEGLGETEPRTIDFDKPEYAPFKVGDKLTPEYIDALPTAELKDKAHQLNRRTEFSVTSTNYVPKK
jgi:peptidoglycan-associated lipoprotein